MTQPNVVLLDQTAAPGVATTSIMGSGLPLVADEKQWLALSGLNQLEVRFGPTQAFPACELLVRFPVVLPNTIPRVNMWRLSLMFDDQFGQGTQSGTFVIP